MKKTKFLVLVLTLGFLGVGCQSSLEVDKPQVDFLPDTHEGAVSGEVQMDLLERANQVMQSFKNGSYNFTFNNMSGGVVGQGILSEFSNDEFKADMNMAYHDGILSVTPLAEKADEDSLLFKDFRISSIDDHSIRFDSDFEKSHNEEVTKTDEKWSGHSYWIFDFSNPPLVSISYHLEYNYEKIVKIEDAPDMIKEHRETETYSHSFNTTFEEIMTETLSSTPVGEDNSGDPEEPAQDLSPKRLEGTDVTGVFHLNIIFTSPLASIEITKLPGHIYSNTILSVSHNLQISEYSDIKETFETEAATIILDLVVIESTGQLVGHIFVNSKTTDESTKYTFDGGLVYF